jgi:hypothetical protein
MLQRKKKAVEMTESEEDEMNTTVDPPLSKPPARKEKSGGHKAFAEKMAGKKK